MCLHIGAPCAPAPEPRIAITLAQAVLKSDKMDEVVRDAVMIGVAAIQPILSSRTETSIDALARGRRRERWQRIAVSSAKQCGRAVVPPIHEPQPFPPRSSSELRCPQPVLVLVEPALSSGMSLGGLDVAIPDTATLMVGPEGGWSAEEVEAASALGSLITIGQRTLRADAMGLVALAALFTHWREF